MYPIFSTNSYNFISLRYAGLSTKPSHELLMMAAQQEISGNLDEASRIYCKNLSNNPEAQAHLKRIETDKNLSPAKRLFRLAEVAEQYESFNTAAHAYNAVLRHNPDKETGEKAEQCLKSENLKKYVIAEK